MKEQQIMRRQEEAEMAYNRVPQSEAAPWLQAVMLSEIALQLEHLNEHMVVLATEAVSDRTVGKLEDINATLDSIRRNGLSVEHVK